MQFSKRNLKCNIIQDFIITSYDSAMRSDFMEICQILNASKTKKNINKTTILQEKNTTIQMNEIIYHTTNFAISFHSLLQPTFKKKILH